MTGARLPVERRNVEGGEALGGAGAFGAAGDEMDEGEGGMAGGVSVLYAGEGGGSVGVLGDGDECGSGDALGECGMGDGDNEGVDDTLLLLGDTAMDGDVPRLN